MLGDVLLLIRHAESEVRVVGGPAEADRPLSPRGYEQALELSESLRGCAAVEVFSSPYRRAYETVTPLADRLGVPLVLRDDLREWDDGLATTPDWLPLYEQCWQDPDRRHGNGETHREVTTRASRAINELLEQAGDRCVVAASHGTWITRGLEGIGATRPAGFWRGMPNPAVYTISRVDGVVCATGPGLD